jgi:hypothetical protein
MKTMILDVASPTEAMAEFVNTWKTKEAEPSARISFASPAVGAVTQDSIRGPCQTAEALRSGKG